MKMLYDFRRLILLSRGGYAQLEVTAVANRVRCTAASSRAGGFAEWKAGTVGETLPQLSKVRRGETRSGSAGRWRRCKWCASLTWVTVTSIIRGNRADKHDSSLSRVLLCRTPSWTTKLERADAVALENVASRHRPVSARSTLIGAFLSAANYQSPRQPTPSRLRLSLNPATRVLVRRDVLLCLSKERVVCSIVDWLGATWFC